MTAFQTFATAVDLQPAPIVPGWITAGQPEARNAIVSRSADGSAYTMVWDCTAGSFDWTYDCDETVHILDGSILLTDAGNPTRRLGPGDAVFFPKGARVSWTVDGYVRKLAFMRQTLPAPVATLMKAQRRLKRLAARLQGPARAATRAKVPLAFLPPAVQQPASRQAVL